MQQYPCNFILEFLLRPFRSACLVLVFLHLILAFLPAGQVQAREISTPGTEHFVPGQVLIQFKTGLGQDVSSQKNILSRHGLQAIQYLPLASATLLPTLEGESVQQAMQRLQQLDAVRYAEPNYKRYLQETVPNDPRFSQQWAHQNIQSTMAWSLETGDPEILIAVTDTGIDYRHEDIQDNMHPNLGYDFSSPKNNPMDHQGHGTHVAGIIGAVGNNNLGISGLNWDVSLLALKFFHPVKGGSVADEIQAIELAVRNEVRVFNMSYGSSLPSKIEKDAIAAAQDILFVAAAGNTALNNDLFPNFPASYDLPNIISVAATNPADQLASFSSFGPCTVHVAAPGLNILSTLPKDKYGTYSGTSMSAPFASGLAGLLLAHSPGLSVSQLRDRILCSTDKIPELEGKILTQGRINVHQALTEIITRPKIFRINPDRANAGSQIAILGANFQDTAGQVYFTGNINARIISWRNDKIVCEVPEDAISGDVWVVTSQGASNKLHFEITVVQSHVVTLYEYIEEYPTIPSEVNQFYPGDQVTAWNYLPDCYAGDQFHWVWVFPDGTLSKTPVQKIKHTDDHCLYSYWSDGIPDQPGLWQVKFYYNQALQYTDTFIVFKDFPPWNSVYNEIFSSTNTQLETLRQFRGEVLLETALGQNYVHRLYDRSHEVALLLLLNPELLAQARSVAKQLLPEVQHVLQGRTGFLSRPLLGDILGLLDAMHAQAGPGLQDLIQDVQKGLQDQAVLDQFGMQTAFD